MLRLNFCPKHKDVKFLENQLNHVMLVSRCWYRLDSTQYVSMCQGFNHFSGFLHHFVLAKLPTSRIRVKKGEDKECVKSSILSQETHIKRIPYFIDLLGVIQSISYKAYLHFCS